MGVELARSRPRGGELAELSSIPYESERKGKVDQ